MSTQMLPKRCSGSMRRLALAAVGISFLVASAATLGADLRTADRSTTAPAPAARRATPTHPTDPLSVNGETSPAFVDQLYKELMEWTPAGCASTTGEAPLRGHC
jgi:hypothetical protein